MTDSGASSAPKDMSHAEIAVFAHELRGALTVIAGYTALLRHPLGEHEQAAALDGIERAIARADSLCSDALSGRAPNPLKARITESVSLKDLAEQTVADQHSATGRDIRVFIESGAEDLTVTGDGQALARVLDNLVGNAAKYSPPPGSVDVRIVRESRPFLGDAAVIEVSDRGPGIPPEMRDLIFEPFQRLPRDEESPGTGLGLAVVKSVVVAHDGRVKVLDREGGGSIVRVELPAESPDPR